MFLHKVIIHKSAYTLSTFLKGGDPQDVQFQCVDDNNMVVPMPMDISNHRLPEWKDILHKLPAINDIKDIKKYMGS